MYSGEVWRGTWVRSDTSVSTTGSCVDDSTLSMSVSAISLSGMRLSRPTRRASAGASDKGNISTPSAARSLTAGSVGSAYTGIMIQSK